MFVHFGLATWQGNDYDDGSTDLKSVNPAKLDPNQWCEVAKSWGAKQILFVAKHVGGFCWWPTATTERCTRNIAWKQGKGDLVQEVAAACRRHGLKMGLYIYPDDPAYSGGIGVFGHSGKTADPARQQEYNAKYRQQWTEVLTRCGPDLVNEIWFDGSCEIPVQDILEKYAPHAVIFQGPNASIRWPGNEEARLRDPSWSSLKSSDLKSGVATQEHDDPDGDAWAPLESDTTLYDHYWFWSAAHERNARKSTEHLVDCYVKSSGRGGVFLLDSSPNTEGRIPANDALTYRAFGKAITQRFGHPLAAAGRVAGNAVELNFGRPVAVNCADLWEDYTYGHRIREYVVEGWVNNRWEPLANGTAVGRRKMDFFPVVQASRLRVRITKSVGIPLMRRFAVHYDGRTAEDSNLLTFRRPVTASTEWSPQYAAGDVADSNTETRWCAAPGDKAPWVEIDLGRKRHLGRATAQEFGSDIRTFQIEIRNTPDEAWRTILTGEKIGAAWASDFDPVTARYVRLHILACATSQAVPSLWDFQIFTRPAAWEQAGEWAVSDGTAGQDVAADLSAWVLDPGQYEIRFQSADNNAAFTIPQASVWFEGHKAADAFLTKPTPHTFLLNRTQAVGEGASSAIHVHIQAAAGTKGQIFIRWKQNR